MVGIFRANIQGVLKRCINDKIKQEQDYIYMVRYKLHHGNCLDVMRDMPDNSVDTIITDPPYGLSFMGKRWDYHRQDTRMEG